VIVWGVVAALAAIAALQGRALLIFFLLAGATSLGWLAYRRQGWPKAAQAILWALVVTLFGTSIGVAATAGENERQAEEPSSTPTFSSSPTPRYTSPTPTFSSPTTSPTPLSTSKPITGGSAPRLLVQEGDSGEFHGGALIVGVSAVFETFAGLNVATSTDECSGTPGAGESLVISGEGTVWYRVWLLRIGPGKAALIRVERLISEDSADRRQLLLTECFSRQPSSMGKRSHTSW
jgi:hypothetical protein